MDAIDLCALNLRPEYVFTVVLLILVAEAYLGKTNRVRAGSLLELVVDILLLLKPRAVPPPAPEVALVVVPTVNEPQTKEPTNDQSV